MSYRSQILTALTVSLIAGTTAFAANVANETELRAALDNVGVDPAIIFTAPITLPDASYAIFGMGNSLTTVGKLNIPDDVVLYSLPINGIETYVKNNNYGAGLSGVYFEFMGNITINNESLFSKNTGGQSGAIYAVDSTTELNGNTTFIENSSANVGAIASSGGTFTINGNATFIRNSSGNDGGAIQNDNGAVFTIDGKATFIENSADDFAGALLNTNATVIITNGAIFKNNSAVSSGGAICNILGNTTLIANTNNVEFTGNTFNNEDIAVSLRINSTLNLNASNSASIIFNDGILSDFDNNVIRINATNADDGNIPVDAPTSGLVVFNADMSRFDNSAGKTGNEFRLYNGTLSVKENCVFGDTAIFNANGGTVSIGNNWSFPDTAEFNASAGSTLDLMNNNINTVSLGTADINGMNLKVDVDFSKGVADTITAAALTNNDITISKVNIIQEKDSSVTTLTVDPNNQFNITLTSGTAAGKVYNYNLFNNNGSISLKRSSVNPVVQSSGVSQQNAYLNVANTNNIAFNRADNVLNLMDNIKFLTGVDYDHANKVAILEGQPEYSKLYGRLEEGAVWFRPFNSIENITIDGVEGKIDSTSYGMMLGFDSPLKRFKRGVKGMLSVYGGYGGASQEYKTIDLYQNGGLVGVMGSLYKGDLYTSLSASVGGYGVLEKIKNYGSSNYGLLTTSIASKTGYNFHLPGRTVLQLNGQAAYSFVSSNDYDNAQGTRIDTAPLHVLQIAPGVKLSKHIGSWQPYLSTSVVFNALNDSAVRANDIVLPDTKMGDYIEYGAGIEKHTESGTSGFLQAMVRNGSRSGINFKFGLKFPVGKREEKI